MNQDMNRIDNENSFLSGPCFIDVEVAIGLHRIQKKMQLKRSRHDVYSVL